MAVRSIIDTAPLVAVIGGGTGDVGRRARREIDAAARGKGQIGVPSLCLFEIAQLEERGRLKLRASFAEWCHQVTETGMFSVVALELDHVIEARAVPSLVDPFDRLIAGTAIALGVPLISSDRRIARSGRLRVIW